jgi:hypothetical protein
VDGSAGSTCSSNACGRSATGSARCASRSRARDDEGAVELLLGSLDPSLRLAFDLGHPSWDGIEPRLAAAGAVRVDDTEHPAPFRYLRRRGALDEAFVERVRALAEPTYVYFRHEDEPTAPAYAEELLSRLR